ERTGPSKETRPGAASRLRTAFPDIVTEDANVSSKRRLSAYRLLIAPLIVSLFLLPGLASAAEYFVSPSGDDGNPGTSRSAPWRSIAKANAALRAGDVVFLLDGRYINDPIKPKSSGIAAQPIRYAAEPGAQPVLTSDKAGGLEVAIDLSGRSFVQVEGVHVDGVQPNPRAHVDHFVTIHGGSHITIRNCTF